MCRTNPITLTSLILVFLSACVGVQTPIVRAAPTAVRTESIQVTESPLGDAVLAIATFVPTPTPSITPVPVTASGLYVYDNFEYSDSIDRTRWQSELPRWDYGLNDYRPIDGVLQFIYPYRRENTPSTHVVSTRSWPILSEGFIRFAAEAKIMIDANVIDHQENVGAEFGIEVTSGYKLSVGYGHDWQVWLAYMCSLSGPNNEGIQNPPYGEIGFNTWHTFRIEILELIDGADLGVAGYVDGFQICQFQPPADWQGAIHAGQMVSIFFTPNWGGLWDHDEPLIFYLDDIAVMVSEPDW